MPIIRIRWRDERPPSLAVSVSAHVPTTTKRIRTRATISLAVAENVISRDLVKELQLLPSGHTRVQRRGRPQVVPFYFLDLHVTLGMLGAVVDRYTYRGVMAVASSRPTPRAGLVIGTDLIRRGQLTVDADSIALCF